MKADLCILGAGSAGLSVAAAAAKLGRRVVLIEKGDMGGDCLNHGCVPSKSLLAAAARAQAFRTAAALGIGPSEPKVDVGAVMAHVHRVIADIAPEDSEARFRAMGCHVIRAPGKFVAPDRVEAGGELIEARRFVIATGSRPRLPEIAGLAAVAYLTNETVFSLTELPDHLLVLGGGPVGVEMAQAWRRLGAKVTLLQSGPRLLMREDAELSAVVEQRLQAEGVEIRKTAHVLAVHPGVRLELQGGERITGSHLLLATGRKATVDGLGLAAAGIRHTAAGIPVDGAFRTSNRRVYAIGDVTGDWQFTHVANYQAGLVIRHALFRLPVRFRPEILPRVTYSDPELAQLGLTEAEADARGIPVRISRFAFARSDRARAMGNTEGLVKVLAGPRGRILGVGIVGPEAGELVAPWALAMHKRLKLSDMAGMVAAYPTLAEAGRRAALDYYTPMAEKRWVRWLLDFLARFG